MKKFLLFVLFVPLFWMMPVKAAHYEVRELIPSDVVTTVVTQRFSYKDLMYTDGKVQFAGIKNLTYDERPVSISIGVFNKNKKNIGTVNFCSADTLSSKEERAYVIRIGEEYLGESNTVDEIKYIAVLSDNEGCRTTGSTENLGQTVEEIGMAKNTQIDTKTSLLLNVLLVLGGTLLAIYLYLALFTRSYQNMDGDSVRKGYKKINKKMKLRREAALRNAPKEEPKPITDKPEEIQLQEEQASKETETDLHNLYK